MATNTTGSRRSPLENLEDSLGSGLTGQPQALCSFDYHKGNAQNSYHAHVIDESSEATEIMEEIYSGFYDIAAKLGKEFAISDYKPIPELTLQQAHVRAYLNGKEKAQGETRYAALESGLFLLTDAMIAWYACHKVGEKEIDVSTDQAETHIKSVRRGGSRDCPLYETMHTILEKHVAWGKKPTKLVDIITTITMIEEWEESGKEIEDLAQHYARAENPAQAVRNGLPIKYVQEFLPELNREIVEGQLGGAHKGTKEAILDLYERGGHFEHTEEPGFFGRIRARFEYHAGLIAAVALATSFTALLYARSGTHVAQAIPQELLDKIAIVETVQKQNVELQKKYDTLQTNMDRVRMGTILPGEYVRAIQESKTTTGSPSLFNGFDVTLRWMQTLSTQQYDLTQKVGALETSAQQSHQKPATPPGNEVSRDLEGVMNRRAREPVLPQTPAPETRRPAQPQPEGPARETQTRRQRRRSVQRDPFAGNSESSAPADPFGATPSDQQSDETGSPEPEKTPPPF